MVVSLNRICRIQWECSLFLFKTGNTLFGQFGPNTHNCLFQVKFGTYTNVNSMQNSTVTFTVSVSDRKYPILGELRPKKQNCQLQLKFGGQSEPNMQNLIGGVQYFCFRSEIPFLSTFGPKVQNC